MTAQLSFSGAPEPTQDEELGRVSTRIGESIAAWCAKRLASGHPRFRADELRRHVDREVGPIAPGSADRVLRNLRQRKVLAYRVISRCGSLYELSKLEEASP